MSFIGDSDFATTIGGDIRACAAEVLDPATGVGSRGNPGAKAKENAKSDGAHSSERVSCEWCGLPAEFLVTASLPFVTDFLYFSSLCRSCALALMARIGS